MNASQMQRSKLEQKVEEMTELIRCSVCVKMQQHCDCHSIGLEGMMDCLSKLRHMLLVWLSRGTVAFCIAVLIITPFAKLSLPMKYAALCSTEQRHCQHRQCLQAGAIL
jgi:hypothetical protein